MESQFWRCTPLPQTVQRVLCLKADALSRVRFCTKDNLEYQWPRQGTLEIPRLAFLKAKLDNNSVNISRTEQDVYFDWHLELSKHCREPKFASLQNEILRVTEANTLLENDKMAPTASRRALLCDCCVSGSLVVPPCPSLWSLSSGVSPAANIVFFLPICAAYTSSVHRFPILILSSNLPFSLKLSLLPFSLNLSESIPFKIKPSENPEVKPLIFYIPQTEATFTAHLPSRVKYIPQNLSPELIYE